MTLRDFTASVTCIWLSVWAFRKRYEVDEKLDPSMHVVRWSVVSAGLATIRIPGARWSALRVVGCVVGVGFLCWPNLAFRTVKLFHSVAGRAVTKKSE